MSKKFSLPKRSATEASTAFDSGAQQNLMPAAFPLDRTNLREDFVRQAKELKEKIVIGPTPVRVEKPKNDMTLKKDGTLSGTIEVVKDGKETIRVDLTDRAKSVKESVKRPVFKRKSKGSATEEITDDDVAMVIQEAKAAGYDCTDEDDIRNYLGILGRDAKEIDALVSAILSREGSATEELSGSEVNELQVFYSTAHPDDSGLLSFRMWLRQQLRQGRSFEQMKQDLLNMISNPAAVSEGLKSEDDQGVINDERDSTDKQPKEAVACESRFPAFNKRERDWVNSQDDAGVRRAVASGDLSRVRGNQLLSAMGATEEIEEEFIPQAADAGAPLEQPSFEAKKEKYKYDISEEERRKLLASDGIAAGESFQQKVTTYIESDIPCKVVYESTQPYKGRVTKIAKEDATQVKSLLEQFGAKAEIVSAKEDCQVVFVKEDEVQTMTWYALVLNKKDRSRVQQLTLTTNGGATQDEVSDYLKREYGNDGVLQVSATKIV